MADVNKSRQALARNLPARGFTMDGLKGTCGEFQIILGDTGWVMKKGSEEIGSAAYGPTQMSDVRTLMKKNGVTLDVVPQAKKERDPAAEAAAGTSMRGAAMQAKAKERAEAKQVFIEDAKKFGFEGEAEDSLTKGEHLLNLTAFNWQLLGSESNIVLASGKYTEKAFAKVEEALANA